MEWQFCFKNIHLKKSKRLWTSIGLRKMIGGTPCNAIREIEKLTMELQREPAIPFVHRFILCWHWQVDSSLDSNAQ
jgi:hypothetical protein